MKLSQDKCHLIVSRHKYENVFASVGQSIIWETENLKLLGIIIYRKRNFNDCVASICRKAGGKLSVLASLSYYMNTKQRRILLKTFLESQFSYCPLVWMFQNRTLNKINYFHVRALRVVHRNCHCSYKDLLKMDQSPTALQRSIQSLAIELLKVKQNISTHIMNNIFQMGGI